MTRTVKTDAVGVLSRDECYELLMANYVGRLAYIVGDRAIVVPVNYRIDEHGAALVLTAPGRKLDAAQRGATLTLQAGEQDDVYHSGWSVLLSGSADVIDDPSALQQATARMLRPWTSTVARTHLLRITPDLVEGRRLV